tara:strand:- start:1413 stop:2072 length:660 start_codon:yes stop_codon:yes gene_type:complete
MRQTTMRAVRIECSPSSISHDNRINKALESVSWDYRGTLGIINDNLRIMVECITVDSQCPQPGFSVGGISVVEILEEWASDYLTHHLLILDFDSELIGDFFLNDDLCILSGTNLTSSGLVIQLSGRQSSMANLLNRIQNQMPVERIVRARNSEGISNISTTLQQHKIVKLAHNNGWYEVPKKTSIRDLAVKLGLSKSTVAEQLVKAEGEIVKQFLKGSK